MVTELLSVKRQWLFVFKTKWWQAYFKYTFLVVFDPEPPGTKKSTRGASRLFSYNIKTIRTGHTVDL